MIEHAVTGRVPEMGVQQLAATIDMEGVTLPGTRPTIPAVALKMP